jgi:hypothetical protein
MKSVPDMTTRLAMLKNREADVTYGQGLRSVSQPL